MDKRKKRVLAVLGVGSVILVWRVYAICTKYLPSSAEAQPQPAIVDPQIAIAPPATPTAPSKVRAGELPPEELAKRLELQEQVAARAWGRDPFEPLKPVPVADHGGPKVRPTVQAPPAPPVKIVGVSESDGIWITVMNGNLYHVGDRTPNGFAVRRINRDSVTLESGGWAYVYSLGTTEPTIARIDGGND